MFRMQLRFEKNSLAEAKGRPKHINVFKENFKWTILFYEFKWLFLSPDTISRDLIFVIQMHLVRARRQDTEEENLKLCELST